MLALVKEYFWIFFISKIFILFNCYFSISFSFVSIFSRFNIFFYFLIIIITISSFIICCFCIIICFSGNISIFFYFFNISMLSVLIFRI